jgi:hypothetical protein
MDVKFVVREIIALNDDCRLKPRKYLFVVRKDPRKNEQTPAIVFPNKIIGDTPNNVRRKHLQKKSPVYTLPVGNSTEKQIKYLSKTPAEKGLLLAERLSAAVDTPAAVNTWAAASIPTMPKRKSTQTSCNSSRRRLSWGEVTVQRYPRQEEKEDISIEEEDDGFEMMLSNASDSEEEEMNEEIELILDATKALDLEKYHEADNKSANTSPTTTLEYSSEEEEDDTERPVHYTPSKQVLDCEDSDGESDDEDSSNAETNTNTLDHTEEDSTSDVPRSLFEDERRWIPAAEMLFAQTPDFTRHQKGS